VPQHCLEETFAQAAAGSDHGSCKALSQAWVRYLSRARLAAGADEAAFLALGMRPLFALSAACGAAGGAHEKGPWGGEGELGAGIAGGERPSAQACCLYILRAGVIELLGEAGQRLMLELLTAMLADAAGPATHVPVAIVVLESAALLLEVLGEATPEARAALERPLAARLLGPHRALRAQAASTLAALAAAESSSAARLLLSSLVALDKAVAALHEEIKAGTGDKSKPTIPGTPRGLGSAKSKPAMDSVHGWATGAAALAAAASRLPLGVPNACLATAARAAASLATAPRGQGVAACCEREAGYVLLGSLCMAFPEVVSAAVGGASVLRLWGPALGEDAAAELDALYRSKEASMAPFFFLSFFLSYFLSFFLSFFLL
jgi:hypothetical protein